MESSPVLIQNKMRLGDIEVDLMRVKNPHSDILYLIDGATLILCWTSCHQRK
jgi:hypothetical protein